MREVQSENVWHVLLVLDDFNDMVIHLKIGKGAAPTSTCLAFAVQILTTTQLQQLSLAHRKAVSSFVNAVCTWLFGQMR
jgi:hypothetical protein